MSGNRLVYFITHADVNIDPNIPVPKWGLSEVGRKRHEGFNQQPFVSSITSIYASAEQKAIDGGEILSAAIQVPVRIVEALHENDRSATGFLPPDEFQKTADRFFASPKESIRSWERAIDAQTRIVSAVDQILASDISGGAIALVAHGGVGTLLLCHLSNGPITRSMDQPGSRGGNYFTFECSSRALLYGWKDICAI